MADAFALNGWGNGSSSDLVDRVESVNPQGLRDNGLIGKFKKMFRGDHGPLSVDSSVNTSRHGFLTEVLLAPDFLFPHYFAPPETRVNSESPGNQGSGSLTGMVNGEDSKITDNLLKVARWPIDAYGSLVDRLKSFDPGGIYRSVVNKVGAFNLGGKYNSLVDGFKHVFQGGANAVGSFNLGGKYNSLVNGFKSVVGGAYQGVGNTVGSFNLGGKYNSLVNGFKSVVGGAYQGVGNTVGSFNLGGKYNSLVNGFKSVQWSNAYNNGLTHQFMPLVRRMRKILASDELLDRLVNPVPQGELSKRSTAYVVDTATSKVIGTLKRGTNLSIGASKPGQNPPPGLAHYVDLSQLADDNGDPLYDAAALKGISDVHGLISFNNDGTLLYEDQNSLGGSVVERTSEFPRSFIGGKTFGPSAYFQIQNNSLEAYVLRSGMTGVEFFGPASGTVAHPNGVFLMDEDTIGLGFNYNLHYEKSLLGTSRGVLKTPGNFLKNGQLNAPQLKVYIT